MNNITKTAITCAALVLTLAGCSQQQVSGDSSQVAGSSQQVAGSSQAAGSSQQVAGSSQSSQQVSPEQVSKECPQCNAPKVEAIPSKPAPKPRVVTRAQGGHVHPANRCTKSIRHNHPNGNRSHSHRYSCQGKRTVRRQSGHYHPANRCTKSIRHNHPNGNRRHSHRYSCQGQARRGSVNIHALQRKLKAKGYYRGPINGVINAETRNALKRYQQRRR